MSSAKDAMAAAAKIDMDLESYLQDIREGGHSFALAIEKRHGLDGRAPEQVIGTLVKLADGLTKVAALPPFGVPICIVCTKKPSELQEYIDMAEAEGTNPDAYVVMEEGTFNAENNHFVCTPCYVEIGMPSSPEGWVAP